MDLEGALVVIGGGSQGIGAGFARVAAARGAREVVLLARRPGPLAETAAAIGPRATPRSVDLSDAAAVAAIAAEIRARSGVPDVVVASSAQGRFLGLAESSAQDAVDAMASTYFAAFYLFREFIADMRARGSGRLVVVGSPVRAAPYPAIAYKASRHALHGLADGLSADLRGTGVGVTYAEPSRIIEGRYFANNDVPIAKLPWFMRDERLRFLWQTEDDAGRMIARAVERDAPVASPAWLRALIRVGAAAGTGFWRAVLGD
jgi:gluconate 5-dehydrogenase